jgi:hypothetical protein
MQNGFMFAANLVLMLHVGIAAFVVAGPFYVIAGNAWAWPLANTLWLRIAHLGAIGIVVAEVLLGVACPLTTLEMALRAMAGASGYDGGFIEYWLQRLLFYDAPPVVFVTAYSLFGLFVLATWWRFPPRRKAG